MRWKPSFLYGMEKHNPVLDKSFEFALAIIDLYKKLVTGGEFIISKQLLRSGTSIGANIIEAQDSSSRAEFRYKLTIALREARETFYWLSLLKHSCLLATLPVQAEMDSVQEIIRLLVAITKTIQPKNALRKP
jgi:four helix bundle protein